MASEQYMYGIRLLDKKGDVPKISKTEVDFDRISIPGEMISISKEAIINMCVFIGSLMAIHTHGHSIGVDKTGYAMDDEPKSAASEKEHFDMAKTDLTKPRLRRFTAHNIFYPLSHIRSRSVEDFASDMCSTKYDQDKFASSMKDKMCGIKDSFVEYLVYKWCYGDETNGEEMLEYVKAIIDTDGDGLIQSNEENKYYFY